MCVCAVQCELIQQKRRCRKCCYCFLFIFLFLVCLHNTIHLLHTDAPPRVFSTHTHTFRLAFVGDIVIAISWYILLSFNRTTIERHAWTAYKTASTQIYPAHNRPFASLFHILYILFDIIHSFNLLVPIPISAPVCDSLCSLFSILRIYIINESNYVNTSFANTHTWAHVLPTTFQEMSKSCARFSCRCLQILRNRIERRKWMRIVHNWTTMFCLLLPASNRKKNWAKNNNNKNQLKSTKSFKRTSNYRCAMWKCKWNFESYNKVVCIAGDTTSTNISQTAHWMHDLMETKKTVME